jgi:hypothetical protein
MARYTEAYSDFTVRVTEVDLLARRAAKLERSDPIKHASEIRAVCRGAVVLLSSHLEGYVRDLGEITLDRIYHKKVDRGTLTPRFFYSISRDHFDLMADSSDPDTIATKVFAFIEADASYWSKAGPFTNPIPNERFAKGFASPSVGKIGKYLHRFGYEGYRHDLAKSLKADFVPTTTTVENMVTVRNNIAHGDANEVRTPADVIGMMRQCQLFCRTTDDVFSNWAKSKLCSLR